MKTIIWPQYSNRYNKAWMSIVQIKRKLSETVVQFLTEPVLKVENTYFLLLIFCFEQGKVNFRFVWKLSRDGVGHEQKYDKYVLLQNGGYQRISKQWHCNPSVLKLKKCGKITLLNLGNQISLFILLKLLLQFYKIK